MGIFTRMSGITRFGRPVYQHANKEYLFYWEATKHWMIGADYTKFGAGVYSQASDALDAYLVPKGSWMETKVGGWQANPAITVVCTSTGMHLAAVHNTVRDFRTCMEKHTQHMCGPGAGELLAGWSPCVRDYCWGGGAETTGPRGLNLVIHPAGQCSCRALTTRHSRLSI